MDLHDIGAGLGTGITSTTTTGTANSSYPQQSISTSPSIGHHLQHFHPGTQRHPHQEQQQHPQYQQQQQQQPSYPLQSTSYSPTITLPPIPTTNNNINSRYLDRDDEEIELWPRSRDQHQRQQQQQQSIIKREIIGKTPDASNGRNMDDSMPSTSDFVKKLYKFVSFLPLPISMSTPSFVGCWKILRFRMWYLGDHWVTVLLSRYVSFSFQNILLCIHHIHIYIYI